MPLYEYYCQRCSQQVEVLVRTATETPPCPECGVTLADRLLSVPAAPAVRNGSRPLPMAGPADAGCGAPRCCGGGCAMD